VNSSTLSDALETARLRLEAAEQEFDAAKTKVMSAQTNQQLHESLLRLRAASRILLDAIDYYVLTRIKARFGARPA
jgi:uncharacterized protein HemY